MWRRRLRCSERLQIIFDFQHSMVHFQSEAELCVICQSSFNLGVTVVLDMKLGKKADEELSIASRSLKERFVSSTRLKKPCAGKIII